MQVLFLQSNNLEHCWHRLHTSGTGAFQANTHSFIHCQSINSEIVKIGGRVCVINVIHETFAALGCIFSESTKNVYFLRKHTPTFLWSHTSMHVLWVCKNHLPIQQIPHFITCGGFLVKEDNPICASYLRCKRKYNRSRNRRNEQEVCESLLWCRKPNDWRM